MKNTIDELALFGGKPCFETPHHVGRPNIGDREKLLVRINELLDRNWLTNDGPNVVELEKRIEDYLGVRHCVAVCNGTMALQILIRAAGLSGEVILPSFTFIATAHALQWLGIRPVFCDIDPLSHAINPDRVEALISSQTSGILGVHVWGRACNVEALDKLAQEHQLKLIFDAAHAFGCSHQGRMIGNFGDAEIVSFHATKCFNTFEGGAVLTNDDELAGKCRLMRNFGFVDYDQVVDCGTNGKMDEMSAAMGLTGLESLDQFIEANRRNYETYRQELREIPGIQLISYDAGEKYNYQYIVAEIAEDVIGISRDQLVEILHAENILARRYFFPGCHRMQPYCADEQDAELFLPETERIAGQVICLPTGTAISAEDIQKVCQIIQMAVSQWAEIRRRLGARE